MNSIARNSSTEAFIFLSFLKNRIVIQPRNTPFFFYTFPANKNSPNFFSPYRRNTHMILNRLNHPHTKHLYAMNPESSLNLPDKASFTIDLYNGLKMIFLMVRNTTPRAEWLSESERMRSQLSAGYQIYFLWQSDFFFRFLHFFSYL